MSFGRDSYARLIDKSHYKEYQDNSCLSFIKTVMSYDETGVLLKLKFTKRKLAMIYVSQFVNISY